MNNLQDSKVDHAMTILNKEMDEALLHKADQLHQMQLWFKILIFVYGGYFSFFAFILSKTRDNSYYLIGLGAALLLFLFGIMTVLIIGYKVSSVIIINKQLAILRKKRLDLLCSLSDKFRISQNEYIYPLNNKTYISFLIRFIPYSAFFLNYLILLGSVVILLSKLEISYNSYIVSGLVGLLLGLFYPYVCISFYHNILTAKYAKTFIEKKAYELKFKKQRKKNFNKKKKQIRAHWLVLCCLIIIASSTLYYNNKVIAYSTFTTIIIFFCYVRYKIEEIVGIRIKL